MSKLIVANWKMNGTLAEAEMLAAGVAKGAENPALKAKLVVCPPSIHLSTVLNRVVGSPVAVGAQDCHWEDKGAFTGDISAAMIRDLGCTYVIVGHSERRHGKGETDAMIRDKAVAAQNNNIKPIICVGELLEERESGRAEAVVGEQLAGSIPESCSEIIIAYEPVWAIGTGKVASVDDVQTMHRFIRKKVGELRPDVPLAILYGGSVKPDNAEELMALPDVGGALVGGASLKAESFLAIAAGVK